MAWHGMAASLHIHGMRHAMNCGLGGTCLLRNQLAVALRHGVQRNERHSFCCSMQADHGERTAPLIRAAWAAVVAYAAAGP